LYEGRWAEWWLVWSRRWSRDKLVEWLA
jgi:hypothetical protein